MELGREPRSFVGMHKLPDDANELIAHFRVKADEARSSARAVAWHDVRLSYEAIAENYEQLAEGAGKLARLLNGHGAPDSGGTVIPLPSGMRPAHVTRRVAH
jgi:hypothetical protein